MHDEVSETENIRKNLSIERMIIEGCDILLDVNQTFVRQGETSSSNSRLIQRTINFIPGKTRDKIFLLFCTIHKNKSRSKMHVPPLLLKLNMRM